MNAQLPPCGGRWHIVWTEEVTGYSSEWLTRNSTCSCLEPLIKRKIECYRVFYLAATVCSHLSASQGWIWKLLRLWRISGVVVDDTPSGCVCVCPHLLQASPGRTVCGAKRQLVERSTSVAGGCKVSPPKAYPRPPCRPPTLAMHSYSNLHTEQNDSKTQQRKMPRALYWKSTHIHSTVLGVNASQNHCSEFEGSS